jgi:hypothetical protein
MTYNPSVKLYYLKGSESASENSRLVPAPQIAINPEFYYANDTIIGYTYNITLTGYATSLDLRSLQPGELGISDTVQAIQRTKNVLNGNNGTLLITDSTGNVVFKATGGLIKELSFEESDNKWVNYCEYSCTIEFNEIETGDCEGPGIAVNCGELPEKIAESPELVDMKEYKIKSYNDSWTFDLSENIYNAYNFTESEFRNEHFSVEYTISATGKHYFVANKLIPAWEQAKNFCQFKIKKQADNLIDKILRRTDSSDGCVTDGDLSTIFQDGPPGLLDALDSDDFKIYNEKISCTTSEAAGSFSATYSAILKRAISEQTFSDADSIHTFTVSKDIQNDDGGKNITFSVQGQIQGLIEGGIVRSDSVLKLPENGSILISATPTTDKYGNALISYLKVANNKSLKPGFLTMLGVTNTALGVEQACVDADSAPSRSRTHSVSHNYDEGIINYSSSYDTNLACSRENSYKNISISVQEKTPIIAEFIIPGRSGGPIIQDIGLDNPKRITISIDGAVPPEECCLARIDQEIENSCGATPNINGVPSGQIANLILIENSRNIGSDGSYSVNRTYICCG